MAVKMKIIEKLKRCIGIQVDTKGFICECPAFWLAYECRRDRSNEIVMPYFDANRKYVDHGVGDIVPVIKRDDMIAYYQIEGIHLYGSSIGDFAGWDDRREYHLIFDHVETIQG